MSYSFKSPFKETKEQKQSRNKFLVYGIVLIMALLIVVGLFTTFSKEQVSSNLVSNEDANDNSNDNADNLNYVNENVFQGQLDQDISELNLDGGRYRVCYFGDGGTLVILDEENYPKYLNNLKDKRVGFYAKFIDREVVISQKCNIFDVNSGEEGKFYILKEGNNVQVNLEKIIDW